MDHNGKNVTGLQKMAVGNHPQEKATPKASPASKNDESNILHQQLL
jgi:hypothetical protein